MIFLSPWLVLAGVLLYSGVHSLLAALRFNAWLRRHLGPTVDRWFRLAYNVLALVSLLPVLALPVILPDRTLYVLPLPWSLLALLGQGAAGLVLLLGLLQTGLGSFLGVSQLFGAASTEPDQLVTDGLYRWVRHPLYTAGLLFLWLIPRMSLNLLALNVGFSLYLVLGAYLEERKLLHKFGQAYQRYQERTPMLIPNFKRRDLSTVSGG